MGWSPTVHLSTDERTKGNLLESGFYFRLIYQFRHFINDFREMVKFWPIFQVRKNVKLLEYERYVLF